MTHGATEVEDEVITETIGDVHAPLIRVLLRRREHNIHQLVGEVILQELLVLEAVRGAGDHANTQRLDEYQHGHDRMWIAAVEYED